MLGFLVQNVVQADNAQRTQCNLLLETKPCPHDFNLADVLISGQFLIVDKHFGYETPFCRALESNYFLH